MRFSPTNPFQDMADTDPVRHFTHFAERLNPYRLAYLHVVEYPLQREGRPEVARHLRDAFEGTFIAAEGFGRDTAEDWLGNGRADLVAFGQHFVATRIWLNAGGTARRWHRRTRRHTTPGGQGLHGLSGVGGTRRRQRLTSWRLPLTLTLTRSPEGRGYVWPPSEPHHPLSLWGEGRGEEQSRPI